MAKYESKQELKDESKYYLICPKCGNEHLHHYYLNDKEKWTEEKINKEKEEAKKGGEFCCVYKEKIYYNDPEFGNVDEPDPGPGWLGGFPIKDDLSIFCKCGYYSHNYKDFKSSKYL